MPRDCHRAGRLLRLRWKRGKTERAQEAAAARAREQEIARPFRAMLGAFKARGAEVVAGEIRVTVLPDGRADRSFWRYVQKRFTNCYGEPQ